MRLVRAGSKTNLPRPKDLGCCLRPFHGHCRLSPIIRSPQGSRNPSGIRPYRYLSTKSNPLHPSQSTTRTKSLQLCLVGVA
jgi:hypothetical protein